MRNKSSPDYGKVAKYSKEDFMSIETAFDRENLEELAKDMIAPPGKYRILCVDKFDHEHTIYRDYDSKDEALEIAIRKTKESVEQVGDYSIATVYYVYDDQGNFIGGKLDKD